MNNYNSCSVKLFLYFRGEVQVRLSANGQSGVSVLDRESRSSYLYRVTVTDTAQLSASMNLSISISDINDNNPRFLNGPYLFSLSENVLNAAVGTVTVGLLILGSQF